MAVKFIEQKDVENNIKKDGVSIVNVFAEWCGPCKMFAPILEDISSEYSVAKINIDKSKEFAEKMKVSGVPTTFIYKDGVLKDSIMGFTPKEEMINRINKL